MTESETEAESLERLEIALRRIAAAHTPRRLASVPGDTFDRDALAASLDRLITRLRAGLKPATPHHQLPE